MYPGCKSQRRKTVAPLMYRSSFVCGPATRVHGHQIFVDGAFNGDPHPGNILLTPDGKLGLIDYGQVRLRVPGTSQAAVNVDLRRLYACTIYIYLTISSGTLDYTRARPV